MSSLEAHKDALLAQAVKVLAKVRKYDMDQSLSDESYDLEIRIISMPLAQDTPHALSQSNCTATIRYLLPAEFNKCQS